MHQIIRTLIVAALLSAGAIAGWGSNSSRTTHETKEQDRTQAKSQTPNKHKPANKQKKAQDATSESAPQNQVEYRGP
jgi:hypothetical protein